MEIIGLRIEKYIGKNICGHNCDFEYYDDELERHVFCAITKENKKVEITLSEEYGECGSGWTTASWGYITVEEVARFNGYTHKPRKRLIIDDIDPNSEDIDNEVFSVSYDGGDSYYPSGEYTVNMDLFVETPRHKDKRPVWLFKGSSSLGKSYLAAKLNDLTVYETDSSDVLPEQIKEDVIVLGNKYDYDVEDIKKVIFGDCELIIVYFSKLEH
jgi:hypothetical protein